MSEIVTLENSAKKISARVDLEKFVGEEGAANIPGAIYEAIKDENVNSDLLRKLLQINNNSDIFDVNELVNPTKNSVRARAKIRFSEADDTNLSVPAMDKVGEIFDEYKNQVTSDASFGRMAAYAKEVEDQPGTDYLVVWLFIAINNLFGSLFGDDEIKSILSSRKNEIESAYKDSDKGEDKGGKSDRNDRDDDDDDSRGERSGTRDDAPKEKTVEEQEQDLKTFLEEHKDLTDGTASLGMMVEKIIERAANANVPHCYKSYVEAIKTPLQEVGGKNKDAWKGTTIEGREFASNPSGLLDFLRFAWVATHGAEQTWLAAAGEIGFNPGGKQLPEDQTVKALIRMGAISPAGLLGVGIEGGGIPSGAKLIFVPGQQFESFRGVPTGAITYEFARDYASGVIITIGAEPRRGPAPGISSDIDAVISAEDSKRIVEKWGEQTTFVMQVGSKTALIDKSIDTGTIIFKMPGVAVTPGRTGAAGDQARVSGMYVAGGRTIPGVTESTPQDIVMSLENVYVDGTGTVKQRVVDATLKKTAMSLRNRDAYELKAVGGDYILIPVTLKRPQTQAATDTSNALHWAAAALGTADAAAQQLAYVPVSEITWQFRGNYQIAGDPVPPIEVVSAVGAPVENVREKGLQLISEEEADIEAVPGSGPFDPFDNAIAAYIRDKNNPVGQALVLTPRLNGAMNSLPIKVSKID